MQETPTSVAQFSCDVCRDIPASPTVCTAARGDLPDLIVPVKPTAQLNNTLTTMRSRLQEIRKRKADGPHILHLRQLLANIASALFLA